jgi:hypothetical protein
MLMVSVDFLQEEKVNTLSSAMMSVLKMIVFFIIVFLEFVFYRELIFTMQRWLRLFVKALHYYVL